ncbi:hypothetical protein MG293_011902 [Ovis ammon polii]|uniref:Uncharacterized protein n=1 Tax=Ovis ammon polii TaxID=230172 RepID=A0AAD4U5S7_OVIAM|nr:hypothetical protein MG293_011902 [Ovis ammon polii]
MTWGAAGELTPGPGLLFGTTSKGMKGKEHFHSGLKLATIAGVQIAAERKELSSANLPFSSSDRALSLSIPGPKSTLMQSKLIMERKPSSYCSSLLFLVGQNKLCEAPQSSTWLWKLLILLEILTLVKLESYNSTILDNSILGRQQAQKATKMPESAKAKDKKAGNSLEKLKKAELSTIGGLGEEHQEFQRTGKYGP